MLLQAHSGIAKIVLPCILACFILGFTDFQHRLLEILRRRSAIVELVDERRHCRGNRVDGFGRQRLKGAVYAGAVAVSGKARHVSQPCNRFAACNGVRVQGFVGAADLGGFSVCGIRGLAHDGDDALHARVDAPFAIHDSGVDIRKHVKECVYEHLRLRMDFFLRSIGNQFPRPVLGVLVQPLAVRLQQFIPQGRGVQRRHIPFSLLECVRQLCLLEHLRPGIRRLGDALLPAVYQHSRRRIHILNDVRIGIVQPFQQLFADLLNLRAVRNTQTVRNLLRRCHDRVVQIQELVLTVAQLG